MQYLQYVAGPLIVFAYFLHRRREKHCTPEVKAICASILAHPEKWTVYAWSPGWKAFNTDEPWGHIRLEIPLLWFSSIMGYDVNLADSCLLIKTMRRDESMKDERRRQEAIRSVTTILAKHED